MNIQTTKIIISKDFIFDEIFVKIPEQHSLQEDNEIEILMCFALFKMSQVRNHQMIYLKFKNCRSLLQLQLQQESLIQQSISSPQNLSLSIPSHQSINSMTVVQ